MPERRQYLVIGARQEAICGFEDLDLGVDDLKGLRLRGIGHIHASDPRLLARGLQRLVRGTGVTQTVCTLGCATPRRLEPGRRLHIPTIGHLCPRRVRGR
jgi:hypothetical protein